LSRIATAIAFLTFVSGQETPGLRAGMSVSATLAGGASASYRVHLDAGEFIHVVVEQRGVDVQLRLLDPENQTILETDSQNGTRGLERVAYVASRAGDHHLDVIAGRSGGAYQLTVAALRTPTTRDLTIADAERAFVAASHSYAVRSADSRQKAVADFAAAAALFESADRRYEAALALFTQGLTEMDLGRPRAALAVLPHALELARNAGDAPLQASLLNVTGGAHDILGDLSLAMDDYNRALAIARTESLPIAQTVLSNIGKLYFDQADWQRALEYFRQAFDGFVTAGDVRRQGLVAHNVGVVYEGLGETTTAVDYLTRALSLRHSVGDKAGEAFTLTALGDAYRTLERPDRALELYVQALDLRRAVGDRRSEAITLVAMAETHRAAGRLSEALPLYEQALALQRESGDRRNEALTLAKMASASRAEPQRAAEFQRAALQIFRAVGDRRGVGDMLVEGARISHVRGNEAEALDQIEEALGTIEEVRSGVASEELRASFLSGRHDAYTLAIDVLAALDSRRPGSGYATRAFEMSERARARSLLDLLAASGAHLQTGADAAMVEHEHRLRQDINSKANRLMNATSTERETLSREVAVLETEYGEVQAAIRRSSPAYAALTQPRPLSVAEIQRDLIDDETVLLEYSLGDEASHLWRVDRHSLTTFTLPAAAVITDAVQQVRRFATTRPAGAARPPALQKAIDHLSDLVVRPLGPELAGKRLAIVADGALEYIPFAMLTTPGTHAVPLVESCELVTLPSASSLALARMQAAGRERPSRGLAVLADPVFQTDDVRLTVKSTARSSDAKPSSTREAADLARMIVHDPPTAAASFSGMRIPRLPYTRAEADSILRTVGGSDNLRAVGFDATKDAVLEGSLKPYRFVHFATHGYVDSARPTLSSVVLSTVARDGKPRDGFLRSHEIYNLELLADVVVLSACETGLGREVQGEGLVGLTRGFMYAGAPRVVVSLWSVSDRATAALMSNFYREMIHNGRTPAAALRAAQRAMLKDPRWAHPYYWAAFVLEGEWR